MDDRLIFLYQLCTAEAEPVMLRKPLRGLPTLAVVG